MSVELHPPSQRPRLSQPPPLSTPLMCPPLKKDPEGARTVIHYQLNLRAAACELINEALEIGVTASVVLKLTALDQWLNKLYAVTADEQIDPALDLVFEHIDDLLSSSKFEECDKLLSRVQVARLDTNLIVGLLSASLAGASQLASRKKLVADAIAILKQRETTERVSALLAGLE